MADFERRGCIWLMVSFILPLAVCNSGQDCTERKLKQCQEGFIENSVPICPEVIKLRNCLSQFVDCDVWPTWLDKLNYKLLDNKSSSYPDCFPATVVKKECEEKLINNCYQQFNHNATPICPEVKSLRRCISELTGCHSMRHPLYVLSRDILEKHRDCFYVNYSRILEVLKKKDSSQKLDPRDTVSSSPKTVLENSTATGDTTDEQDSQSSHLPYTFVVVATVFTCLFLMVLVVFSIIRHTTLTKRQRNSTVERAPMRIRIQSPNSRQRTRHHRHRHSNRTRHTAIHGARQTVSGFFEGNVPPPPYSAVLDDAESIRAGDPPPPYQPPSRVTIGVVV